MALFINKSLAQTFVTWVLVVTYLCFGFDLTPGVVSCVKEAGQVSIELASLGFCHHPPGVASTARKDSGVPSQENNCGACIDIPFATQKVAAARSSMNYDSPSPQQNSSSPSFLLCPLNSRETSGSSSDVPCPSQKNTSLNSLRSTILLI